MSIERKLREVNPALVERCQPLPDLGEKRFTVGPATGLTYTQAYERVTQAESTGKDAAGAHILRHGGHARLANLNRLHLPRLLQEVKRRAEAGENADDLKIALGLMEAPAAPVQAVEQALDTPPRFDEPLDLNDESLLWVLRQDGPVQASRVAEQFNIPTTSASHRLNQLVKENFLTKDRPKAYGPWQYETGPAFPTRLERHIKVGGAQ